MGKQKITIDWDTGRLKARRWLLLCILLMAVMWAVSEFGPLRFAPEHTFIGGKVVSSFTDITMLPVTRQPLQLTSQEGNSVDQFILQNLMSGIKFRGTYVEFGCADGITNSNTWALEQLGWFGLCIEANTLEMKLASQHRHTVVHSLIGEKGSYTFVEMDEPCMQISGIKEFYSDAYIREYEKCKSAGAIVSESTVQTRPLEDILLEHHIDTVTYISVDCEGCEFSFIKSFNFTAFDVQIFNYEDNTVAQQHKEEINKLLDGHGFRLVFEAGDRLFVRNSAGL